MSENNRASVYVHINLVNGKKYFGVTVQNPPENRWRNGNGYYYNAHFMNAVKKYRWDNFGHFVLYKNISINIAKNIEEMLIREHMSYDPRFGYNKTMGGELEIPTEEARKKMSEAKKGHEVSEETRRKISKNNGMKRPEVAAKFKGKNNPTKRPEVAAKISSALSNPVEAIDPKSGQRVLYFKSTRDTERAGFYHSAVVRCCNGERRTHAGLMWRYVEEVNNDDGNN